MAKTKMSGMTKGVIALGIIVIVAAIIFFVLPTANKFSTVTGTGGNDLGFNIAFNSNIGNDSCPIASVNDITMAKHVGANNFRSYMPEEIVSQMGFETPNPSGIGTCLTMGIPPNAAIPQAGTLAGFKSIVNDPNSSLLVAIDLKYNLASSVPDSQGWCPGLLFAEALKKYTGIKRLQIGLVSSEVNDQFPSTGGAAGKMNPTETSLRSSIYTAINGSENIYPLTYRPYNTTTGRAVSASDPSVKKYLYDNTALNNIMLARLDQIYDMLNDIGRLDIEIIIPAQGDTEVDDKIDPNTTTYSYGNIFGPPKSGAKNYTVAQFNSYQPYFDALMAKINYLKSKGLKINYLASTL
jgi:hypothetical protein